VRIVESWIWNSHCINAPPATVTLDAMSFRGRKSNRWVHEIVEIYSYGLHNAWDILINALYNPLASDMRKVLRFKLFICMVQKAIGETNSDQSKWILFCVSAKVWLLNCFIIKTQQSKMITGFERVLSACVTFTVRRRSRRTFSTHFEIFRRRFDGVVIYFFNFDFKFFDDASEFSVISFYVVFIF